MTDDEIRDALKELDQSDEMEVDSWEAEFIEHVVYKYKGPLSDRQKKKAEDIIEKYMA